MFNMNQNQLMSMLVTNALKNLPPSLIASVEQEALRRGMSQQDIAAGKQILASLRKEV